MPLILAPLLLSFIATLIWRLLRQVDSPWWLENILSTPFSIIIICLALMIVFSYFFVYQQSLNYCLIYYLNGVVISIVLATCLNNISVTNKKVCIDPVTFFQFNIKYTEKTHDITALVEHLIEERYHLVALQGVSQKSKNLIINKLNPYYPNFIRGENKHQQVYSDQLLFSRYAFTNIQYYKNGHSSFLLSSQWHLPFSVINLYSLHPPSPRNERLWQARNKSLYQLESALKNSAGASSFENSSLVRQSLIIGDLNLSKHSNRIHNLKQGMNTEFVNSWPHKPYIASAFGLAIDHFLVSKPTIICSRQRLNEFSWSDHYAIKTEVEFKK